MTLFTVEDLDLYFRPSAASAPLHTLGDTDVHAAASLQSAAAGPLTSPQPPDGELV